MIKATNVLSGGLSGKHRFLAEIGNFTKSNTDVLGGEGEFVMHLPQYRTKILKIIGFLFFTEIETLITSVGH
jgi:hypothetical protein